MDTPEVINTIGAYAGEVVSDTVPAVDYATSLFLIAGNIFMASVSAAGNLLISGVSVVGDPLIKGASVTGPWAVAGIGVLGVILAVGEIAEKCNEYNKANQENCDTKQEKPKEELAVLKESTLEELRR